MSVEKQQMIPSLMKILGLLLLFAVIVGCSDTQPTLTPEEINALIDAKIEGVAIDTIDSIYSIPAAVNAAVSDSIVWIRIDTTDGDTRSGTGFVVRDDYIATCYHVIERFDSGYVSSVYDNKKYLIQSVVAIDEAHDLAIIKTDFRAPHVILGESDTVSKGDTVYVIGNPDGWKGTLSQGVISAIRPNGFLDVKDTVYQMTASTGPGSSGSPVVNRHARVVAIHYASDNAAENLNFIVPVKHLKTLLSTLK